MIKQHEPVKLLENGQLYFFYRPKVEEHTPKSIEDVQNFYMILHPEGMKKYRMIIIGRKKLPPITELGKQFWGLVETVKRDPERIVQGFLEKEYKTGTSGKRNQPAARPAGEGVYRLIRHEDHTHFVYALELPKNAAEVQKALNIEGEASYVISVKNPSKQKKIKPDLSEEQNDKLEGHKFVAVDPPSFLDKEGIELLFISAAKDVKRELGFELNPKNEDWRIADIFKDLHIDKKSQPVKPLLKGKWA
jgi:hypothetical protein